MSDASAVVDDCARWSGALWNKEYVGMGDTQESAMYRASARHGIEPGVFWALRYRSRPNGVASNGWPIPHHGPINEPRHSDS